jgi:hypothetical protein
MQKPREMDSYEQRWNAVVEILQNIGEAAADLDVKQRIEEVLNVLYNGIPSSTIGAENIDSLGDEQMQKLVLDRKLNCAVILRPKNLLLGLHGTAINIGKTALLRWEGEYGIAYIRGDNTGKAYHDALMDFFTAIQTEHTLEPKLAEHPTPVLAKVIGWLVSGFGPREVYKTLTDANIEWPSPFPGQIYSRELEAMKRKYEQSSNVQRYQISLDMQNILISYAKAFLETDEFQVAPYDAIRGRALSLYSFLLDYPKFLTRSGFYVHALLQYEVPQELLNYWYDFYIAPVRWTSPNKQQLAESLYRLLEASDALPRTPTYEVPQKNFESTETHRETSLKRNLANTIHRLEKDARYEVSTKRAKKLQKHIAIREQYMDMLELSRHLSAERKHVPAFSPIKIDSSASGMLTRVKKAVGLKLNEEDLKSLKPKERAQYEGKQEVKGELSKLDGEIASLQNQIRLLKIKVEQHEELTRRQVAARKEDDVAGSAGSLSADEYSEASRELHRLEQLLTTKLNAKSKLTAKAFYVPLRPPAFTERHHLTDIIKALIRRFWANPVKYVITTEDINDFMPYVHLLSSATIQKLRADNAAKLTLPVTDSIERDPETIADAIMELKQMGLSHYHMMSLSDQLRILHASALIEQL